VLRAKGRLGTEGIENLKTSLEIYRGTENAGKVLILEEDMAFDRIGMTAVDAQFVETIGATRTDIAMFFGVPPHMLGDTTKSTSWGTGIEQQSIGFVTWTLEDHLTMWEEAINVDLLDDENLRAKFNRSALVKGDIKARWDAYVKALQWGVFSPDDVLALEDRNPRADGEGGKFYDPPNTAGGDKSDDEDERDEPPPAS
jgi:HK97 family phage portal protein